MHHFADTDRNLQQDSGAGTETEGQTLGSAPKPAWCLPGLSVTEHSSPSPGGSQLVHAPATCDGISAASQLEAELQLYTKIFQTLFDNFTNADWEEMSVLVVMLPFQGSLFFFFF